MIRCRRVDRPLAPRTTFDRRVAILIPAYNEALVLGDLVAACRRLAPAVVLVVDDGSTDGTARVLERLLLRAGPGAPLCALHNPVNLGKQGAVRRGLRALASLQLDAVALLDGDGQHDPAELPWLAGLLERFDFVIGERSQAHMPLPRRVSNWLVNAGYRWIGGLDFFDVQSGLRLYRQELARLLAAELPERGGYALEHESLAVLAHSCRRRSLEAAAAPIGCRYAGAHSSLRPLHVLQLGLETVQQAWRIRHELQPAGDRVRP